MLNELVKKAELAKAGIADPFEKHRKRPFLEHLNDFEADLRAKRISLNYVRRAAGMVRRVLTGCGFVFAADLSASRMQQFLADLQKPRKPLGALDPAKESYTRRELAAALGVKEAAVTSLVRRHRLEATGKGKARRYPHSTAVALHERLARGPGARAVNYYLRSFKQFCRWLVKDRRMPDNPLAHLSGVKITESRHDGRPLTEEELPRLLQTTLAIGRPYRDLTGTLCTSLRFPRAFVPEN
jgi:hypothetical protein